MWQANRGMTFMGTFSVRILVIHQYDAVDINQVWDTTQHKLPPLVAELSKIVPPE